MCGIVGKVWRHADRRVSEDLIGRMQQCVVHRGPDDKGSHFDGPAGLGFRRLSIIDLKSGHQPMLNEDGSVAIVFNGEVYNFPELRDELIAHGHVFATRSDTETILHGYEQWGTHVVERLRGMFAFAVFDRKDNSLFLARDRVGKKPLFYALLSEGSEDESLVFASELKSLLADPLLIAKVDLVALSHFLTYQYVPQPWSILEGVQKLPPGHWLLWKEGRLSIARYWDLQYEPKIQIGDEDAVERTLEMIDEAVRIRLMSEVPLGCFLSGGIDSSAIVAMMRRHISGDLKTFSIGFREDAYNELPYARQVAKQFETHHEEFIVEPDAVEVLGELAWFYDEPMADESSLPTYYLSKLTRQFVTVALNGDGGDESFAGYRRYCGIPQIEMYKRLPRWMRSVADGPIQALSGMAPRSARLELLATVNRISLEGREHGYLPSMTIFADNAKRRLIHPQHRHVLNEADAFSEQLTLDCLNAPNAREWVDRMMYADIMLYLPGALLPKVDRATMAHSVEGRSPFLDHRLMEFAARLPAAMKFSDGVLKRLLKKAMKRFFPDEFLNRPKMGFGVPVREWLRHEMRDLTYDYLLGERARNRGYFDMDYVRMLIEQHMAGRRSHHQRLWALLVFEAWCRTFLDREDPLAGPIRT